MRAVISTIGQDRPGLVGELTDLVAGLGLNVEDSRMTVLGGEFAILMSVVGDEARLQRLQPELQALCERTGLAHLYRPTSDAGAAAETSLQLTVSAMDHPGIVSQIAGFFSRRGANIRSLETQTQAAAHTGTPIFSVELTVDVPAEIDGEHLAADFMAFCDSVDLDGEVV